MKKISGKKRRATKKDSKKERIFKCLAAILQTKGILVRRENLKQGHGWKAMSGLCRFEQDNFLFVDTRMSQDDQIAFLMTKIASLDISVSEEQVVDLPKKLVEQFEIAGSVAA